MKLIWLMKNFQVKRPRKFQNIPGKLWSPKPLSSEGLIHWAPILTDVDVTEPSCIREQKSGSQIALVLRWPLES